MRSVIFDLDGTLIDSAPDIHAAVNRSLAEIGAPGLSPAQVASFIGNGVPVLIERVIAAGALTVPHAELVARFLRHYNADPATLTRLYPNVRVMLETLSSEGCALGICTNKPEAPTRTILQSFGIADLFGVIVGGDTMAARKPDPAPLRHAADRLGRDRVTFVGDSEVDAETARRAALPFALFTEGYRKTPVDVLPHDMAFSDFAALPGLLRQVEAGAA